jgi:hypothetical protein
MATPDAKGPSLLFLAFFLPLGVYLLVLGSLNRRRHPVLVRGVWDFIGILFAASGFLLFGGPAIFSSRSEGWRTFWMLGQGGVDELGGGPEFWVFVSALYFFVVVAAAAFFLWRQRPLTSVYNVEPGMVEQALAETCEGRGLNPVRSGNLFLFGAPAELFGGPRGANGTGIQAAPYPPLPARPADEPGRPAERTAVTSVRPAVEVLGQTVVLEVEPFPFLHHVTLRWDPADAPLRAELEQELARRLAARRVPPNEVGAWLTVIGCGLLGFTFLWGLGLVLLRFAR